MKSKKQSPITYKREKNKVEISGEPKDTKWLIWFDLISSKFWIVPLIVLLFTIPKASFLPLVWVWVKKQVPFLTIFMVAVDWWKMLLSG